MKSFLKKNKVGYLGITLTSTAVQHIHKLTAKKKGVLGIRLDIRKTGCAGFSYVVDTIKEPKKCDVLFNSKGIRIYIPISKVPFIDGTVIDYVNVGLNQVLKFNNPRVKNTCGCGESVTF